MKQFNLKTMLCLTAVCAAMLAGCDVQSVPNQGQSGSDVALLPADSTTVSTATEDASTTVGATALTTLIAPPTTTVSATTAVSSTASSSTTELTSTKAETTSVSSTTATTTTAASSATSAATAATTVSSNATAATTVASTAASSEATTVPTTDAVNLFSELTLGSECSAYIAAHGGYDFHEATSCMGDGMDRVYVYNGYTIFTYFDGKQELLTEVDLLKSGFVTPKGAQVGWTRAQVESVYGKDAFDSYERGGSFTQFKYEGDIVSSIELFINWV